MKPTRLLDPRFKWVPSDKTDIRKTFAKIRKEQAKEAEMNRVIQIKRRWA